MTRLIPLCLSVVVVLTASPGLGQERLPIGTRVGSSVSASSGESDAAAATYDEAGRRDPFVRPIAAPKAAAPAARTPRPTPGLGGVAVADVSVKGVVRNGSVILAVLEGPGGKSFVARTLDRLQDAVVKAIDSDGVVFAQQTVDVGRAAQTHEVRKSLRPIAVEEDR